MNGTPEQLRQVAVAIVAAHQPCSPYTLLDALRRDYGAGTGAANATMLTLIRDGLIRRTVDGRLALPNGGGGGMSTTRKIVLTVFLLAIAAFMAWVFYNMVVRSGGPPDEFPGLPVSQR